MPCQAVTRGSTVTLDTPKPLHNLRISPEVSCSGLLVVCNSDGIAIGVIRSNWDCNHKLLQAVHKDICTLVSATMKVHWKE